MLEQEIERPARRQAIRMRWWLAVASVLSGGLIALAYFGPRIHGEMVVRDHLRDPGSAVFSGVTYNWKTGATCGFVNARNAFGGYVGLRHFVADKSGGVDFEPDVVYEGASVDEKLNATRARLRHLTFAVDLCGE